MDRLLASPRYGERWARHWLDVVHYGDTHGYDKDKPRPNAWPYRDYVIRAFNDDKPYARFVRGADRRRCALSRTRATASRRSVSSPPGRGICIGHAEVPETKIDGKIARHLDRDDMVANTIGTFCSADGPVRAVPQPQVRPDHAGGLLLACRPSSRRWTARIGNTIATTRINARFAGVAARSSARPRARSRRSKEPLKAKAGERAPRSTRKIDGASKAAAQKQGNASPDFGYHSAISPTQDAVKWVQVDLGKRVAIDHVVLLPCYDDFNAIGAGFGFPGAVQGRDERRSRSSRPA